MNISKFIMTANYLFNYIDNYQYEIKMKLKTFYSIKNRIIFKIILLKKKYEIISIFDNLKIIYLFFFFKYSK